MRQDIGIFVNSTAPLKHKKLASKLHNQIPSSKLFKITFPLKVISDEINTVIVFGGDGTIREITQQLLQRDTPATLLIIPSGSQNGFYHSLKNNNSVITLQQFLEGEVTDIPLFYPGTINGIVFNHLADYSYAGVMQAEEAEIHRKFLPKVLRSHTGVISTWVKLFFLQRKDKYRTLSFMTSSYVGPFKLYSHQNLYSDTITSAVLEARSNIDTAKKLLVLLFYALRKKDLPPSLKFITQKSFVFPYKDKKVNVDGEIQVLPKKQKVHVERSTKAIKAAAFQVVY